MNWRSNLKLKLLASYFGQTYATLVGVLIAPVYLRFLGAEGYGLIGVFTLMQTWLALLDMGFSATLARETARFGAGQGSPAGFRRLVDVMNRIFLVSGLAFAAVGVAASPWISRHWLKIGALNPTEVTLAVAVMVVTVAIRWRTEPYRSILVGLERQVWLNVFNSIIVSFRYFGVIAVLAFVNASLTTFFVYQLVLTVTEAAVIITAAHRLLPRDRLPAHERKSAWKTLRPLLKFSLGVAFSALVWLLISQFDKLVLSAILPLKAYGVYALAVMAASAVSLLGGPASQVVLPRLTALKAKDDEFELRRIYRTATAMITALVTPASLVLALFGGEIMWVWTGDRAVAAEAMPILRWYALGNGCLAVTSFSYYLQFAHGDLKRHVIGNTIFALVLAPAMVFAALHYGAVGAGMVWFASNVVYLLGWTLFVHARFAPGLHWGWFGRSVLLVAVPGFAILFGARLLGITWYESRWLDLLKLALMGVAALGAGGLLIPGAPANVAVAFRLVRARVQS